MKFKEWKAGDEAFLVGFGWVILESDDSILYPLRFRAHAFTKDGKNWKHDRYPSLLDHNPFDKSDPKNPPAHGTEWPFLLRGRRLEIGMEILVETESGIVPARIMTLQLSRSGVSVGARHTDGTSSVVWSPVIIFPDELPVKKKVADWVYTYMPNWGETRVEFAKGLTEEEINRLHGASGVTIRMIPDTEREVEV